MKEVKTKVPFWFNILLTMSMGFLLVMSWFYFGIVISAMIILVLSAFFNGYLAVVYTLDYKIASSAKSVAMIVGITGITVLFISVGWWGLGGIVLYWILIGVSMNFWRNTANL